MLQHHMLVISIMFFTLPCLTGCLTISRLVHFPERPQVYATAQCLTKKGWNPYCFLDDKYDRSSGGYWEDRMIVMKIQGRRYMISFGEIDLVFSLAADTILLPITIPAEIFSSNKMEYIDSMYYGEFFPYWIGRKHTKNP